MSIKLIKVPVSDTAAGQAFGLANTNQRLSLTMIFRDLLKDSGLSEDQFEDKLLDWRDKKFADETSETVIDFAMQDLRKAIKSEQMAWEPFCDALDVLGYSDFKMLF